MAGVDILALLEQDFRPIFIDEEPYTYALRREHQRRWIVNKMFGNDLVIPYTVSRIKDQWLCNCIAGSSGKLCKHVKWVSTIVDIAERIKG